MARQKKPKSASADDQKETLARKIWLAGLGAYGKGVEEAQDRIGKLDRASQDAQRAFEDLVQKGQRIEASTRSQFEDARERLDPGSVRERFNEARERLSDRVADSLQGAAEGTRSVEEMIERVRRRVGADDPVSRRIDALSRDVADLARAVTAIAGIRFGADQSTEQATSKRASSKGDKNTTTAPKPKAKTKATAKPGPKRPAAKSAMRKKSVAKPKATARSRRS